jgi:putative serine protease PepD
MPQHGLRRALAGRLARTVAVAAAAAVVGAGVVAAVDVATEPAATATQAVVETTPVAETAATPSGSAQAVDFSAVYARRRAGVVSIAAGSGPAAGSGTGVVIDDEGRILTNEHVVSGASSVSVELADGRVAEGTVVGTDPSTDLAMLQVDVPAGELEPIPLGDSSQLAVGDPVLAIGDPFGYEGSASAGIVSGLGRTMVAPNGFSITGAIQTDAAVNHGNSGGALLNARGELVGIPAQIADSGVDGNVGVAFAVPSDTAAEVVAALSGGDEVDHAWLGVSTEDAPSGGGARVTGLAAGGPAEEGGLRCGDRIVAVGEASVADSADLQEAVDSRRPGAEVVLRAAGDDGEERAVTATLGERPASAGQAATSCPG